MRRPWREPNCVVPDSLISAHAIRSGFDSCPKNQAKANCPLGRHPCRGSTPFRLRPLPNLHHGGAAVADVPVLVDAPIAFSTPAKLPLPIYALGVKSCGQLTLLAGRGGRTNDSLSVRNQPAPPAILAESRKRSSRAGLMRESACNSSALRRDCDSWRFRKNTTMSGPLRIATFSGSTTPLHRLTVRRSSHPGRRVADHRVFGQNRPQPSVFRPPAESRQTGWRPGREHGDA